MRRVALGIAIFGVLGGILYLMEGRRYSWGTLANPGPGLYPFLVGALLVLGALGTAIEGALQEPRGEVEWPQGPAWWRILAILTASFGYAVLVPSLGHPLASALVTLVVVQAMGMRFWPLKIGLALTIGLGSHYLFAVVLGVPLPTGTWFS